MSSIPHSPSEADRVIADWRGTLQQARAVLKLYNEGSLTREHLEQLVKRCPVVMGLPVLHVSHPVELRETYTRQWHRAIIHKTRKMLVRFYATKSSPFFNRVFRQEYEEVQGIEAWDLRKWGEAEDIDRLFPLLRDEYRDVRDFLLYGDDGIRIHREHWSGHMSDADLALWAEVLAISIQKRPSRYEWHTEAEHAERIDKWLEIRTLVEQMRPEMLWSSQHHEVMADTYEEIWHADFVLADREDDHLRALIGGRIYHFYEHGTPLFCQKVGGPVLFSARYFNEIAELLPASGVTADDLGFHVDAAGIERRLFEHLDQQYGSDIGKIKIKRYGDCPDAQRSPGSVVRRYKKAADELARLPPQRWRNLSGDTKLLADILEARPQQAAPTKQSKRRLTSRR